MTDKEQLELLLDLSGVHPGEQDLEFMVPAYVTARENAALVFSVEGARYGEPGLIFSAKL